MLIRKSEVHPQPESPALSEREWQIMLGLAIGKTVTQLSRESNLSVKTISTYRGRILKKTGLKNNAQITMAAMNQGLIGDQRAANQNH